MLIINADGGKKEDGNKTRYDLLPLAVLRGMAQVMTFGAAKYGQDNWQKVELHRYIAALHRHLDAVLLEGEGLDKDTKLPHAYHFATNAIFIAWKMVFRPAEVTFYRRRQLGEIVEVAVPAYPPIQDPNWNVVRSEDL